MKLLLIFPLLFSLNLSAKVDHIIIYKKEREMLLMDGDEVVRSYDIRLSRGYYRLGFKPGPKRLRGDFQTPEGEYKVKKKKRNTKFRKSLEINYPNIDDVKWGKEHGYSYEELGSDILIHGESIKPDDGVIRYAMKLGISEDTVDYWAKHFYYPFFDWTEGCVAVNEFEIEEIFDLVSEETKITIFPKNPSTSDDPEIFALRDWKRKK